MLKLTVASYYRPSGENIHRFRNAKTTDKWGVSPDKGCEVKLTPREYVEWFRARRDRDLAAGHRLTPPAKPSDDKKTEEKPAEAKKDEPKKAEEKPAETKKDDSKKEAEKAQPKRRSTRRRSGPLVDKQLDKALEVIRSKLSAKAKAA